MLLGLSDEIRKINVRVEEQKCLFALPFGQMSSFVTAGSARMTLWQSIWRSSTIQLVRLRPVVENFVIKTFCFHWMKNMQFFLNQKHEESLEEEQNHIKETFLAMALFLKVSSNCGECEIESENDHEKGKSNRPKTITEAMRLS